jgi:hypothetical protein
VRVHKVAVHVLAVYTAYGVHTAYGVLHEKVLRRFFEMIFKLEPFFKELYIFLNFFFAFMTWTGFAGFPILDLLTTTLSLPINPFRALSNNMAVSSTGKAAHLPALPLLGGLLDEDVDIEQAAVCDHGVKINAVFATTSGKCLASANIGNNLHVSGAGGGNSLIYHF